jgi:lysine 2,3-aminomutase
MGGGGKRDVHSFEHYNRKSGVAVFTSPAVKPGKKFLYFDPSPRSTPNISGAGRSRASGGR